MDAWIWVLIAIGIVAIVVVAWMARRNQRTGRLRESFGPEYDRTLDQHDNRRSAEAELTDRRDRRDQLDIRELSPAAAERYTQEWRVVQQRFVDEPVGAVGEADRLIGALMRERGYPVDDFEVQAEMISVDHPRIVEEYRKGHRIHLSYDRGEASTEDLRRAMVHYRTLLEDLLETSGDVVPDRPVHSGRAGRTEEW